MLARWCLFFLLSFSLRYMFPFEGCIAGVCALRLHKDSIHYCL